MIFTHWRSIVLFRILVSLLTSTTFQPDEYYQSLEPAHQLVFGYGHLTWEWLSAQPIRSIVYPLLNVPVYWLLKITGLDEWSWTVVVGPKIVHGALASLTDIWIHEITRKSLGQRYAATATFLSITSFFNALSLSRSLSNSLETSLSTVAFAYYPWDLSPKLSPQVIFYRPNMRKMILFAGLSCMVRPTNAIIWIFLLSKLLWALRSSRRASGAIIKDFSLALVASLALQFLLDSIYYSKPTITPLNFLRANSSNISLFYGQSSWLYYPLQALPILTTTALPFALVHAWQVLSRLGKATAVERNMWQTMLWTMAVYSLAGHKEWRFIHPILPLLHVCASKPLVDLSTVSNKTPNQSSILSPPIRPWFYRFILLNVPVALYITLFYCSAPISVTGYLRSLPQSEVKYNNVIGFVMPCHSVPGFAYLHRKELSQEGKVWALGCEPPLKNEPIEAYKDQTKVFYESPIRYFESRFPSTVDSRFPASPYPATPPGQSTSQQLSPPEAQRWKHNWPRYLVLFGALLEEEGIRELLIEKGYREVWNKGRWWEGDVDERKGGVRVWKWDDGRTST